jgi:hypothetical protein
MWIDPIVEEVRRARDAYARRFNYDLSKMVSDLQSRQKEHGEKSVDRSARAGARSRRKRSAAVTRGKRKTASKR